MKDRIKLIRTKAGESQTAFASRLSVSRSAICKMESGENSPSEQTIALICKEFNVNETWLRTGEGDMNIELTRNQEIQVFANQVMSDVDDSIKKRLILALSKLNKDDWNTIEKIVNELAKK